MRAEMKFLIQSNKVFQVFNKENDMNIIYTISNHNTISVKTELESSKTILYKLLSKK